MMNNTYYLIVFLGVSILCTNAVHSQCEPDTVNCIDVMLPGELCPRPMPDGYVNQPYHEVFTVIPPTVTYVGTLPVDVVKIVVTDIINLPPGLSYQMNAEEFYADTAYCVLVSGTPEMKGTYNLGITVVPYLYIAIFDSVMVSEPVVDDTSLIVTIHPPAGLNEVSLEEQYVSCGPNPFRHTTKISLNSRSSETAVLNIYNLMGRMVYREELILSQENNSFVFDGRSLKSGSYLYNVSTASRVFTNRLIKLKK